LICTFELLLAFAYIMYECVCVCARAHCHKKHCHGGLSNGNALIDRNWIIKYCV